MKFAPRMVSVSTGFAASPLAVQSYPGKADPVAAPANEFCAWLCCWCWSFPLGGTLPVSFNPPLPLSLSLAALRACLDGSSPGAAICSKASKPGLQTPFVWENVQVRIHHSLHTAVKQECPTEGTRYKSFPRRQHFFSQLIFSLFWPLNYFFVMNDTASILPSSELPNTGDPVLAPNFKLESWPVKGLRFLICYNFL